MIAPERTHCRIHGTRLTWTLEQIPVCRACQVEAAQTERWSPVSQRVLSHLEQAEGPRSR